MKVLNALSIAGASVGLLLACSTSAAPKEPTLDQRVQSLEQVLRNQSLSDIVLQLQRLQQEVQELRGELEVQSHAMEAMQRRQRDLYLDIDQRLGQMQPGSAGAMPSIMPPDLANDPAPLAPPPDMPEAIDSAPTYDSALTPDSAPAPVAVVPTPPTGGGDPAKELSEYQAAFDLLKQGQYKDSIVTFRRFMDLYPQSKYAGNAQYWLGEASYVTRDFDTALTDFARVLAEYSTSPKVPDSMLKMGFIHYEQKSWAKARELLTQVTAEYPTSTVARLAQQRLDRMTQEGQ